MFVGPAVALLCCSCCHCECRHRLGTPKRAQGPLATGRYIAFIFETLLSSKT